MKTDDELIKNVMFGLIYLRQVRSRKQRVKEAFSVSDAQAMELCKRYGLDPDEMIGTEKECW